MKQRKIKDYLDYKPPEKEKTYTREERMIHQSWCFENGIHIYPIEDSMATYKIVIENKNTYEWEYYNKGEVFKKDKVGKKKTSFKKKDKIWYKEIFKLYTYYYEQNNSSDTK